MSNCLSMLPVNPGCEQVPNGVPHRQASGTMAEGGCANARRSGLMRLHVHKHCSNMHSGSKCIVPSARGIAIILTLLHL
jgi:hypothetical protein